MSSLSASILSCLVLIGSVCPLASSQAVYSKEELQFLQGTHRIGARTWGMGGAGVAVVNDVTAICTNPARLAFLEKLEWYGEIGRRSGIEWLPGYTGETDIEPAFPGFCGVRMGLTKHLSFGCACYGQYGTRLDLGQGLLAGGGDDGTGTERLFFKALVRKLSVSISCRLRRSLSVGLTCEYNRARSTEHYGDVFGQGTDEYAYSGDGWSFLLGLHAALSPAVSIGATFRPGYSIEGREQLRQTEPDVRFTNDFPSDMRIGCSCRVTPRLTLATDFMLTMWGRIRDAEGKKPYENTLDMFSGAEWRLNGKVSLRWGYCTSADPWKNGLRAIGESQNFLTAGGTVTMGSLSMSVAFMDSHLLQSEDVETTKLFVGCTYQVLKGGWYQ